MSVARQTNRHWSVVAKATSSQFMRSEVLNAPVVTGLRPEARRSIPGQGEVPTHGGGSL